MNKGFFTSDLNLVSYLISQGEKVTSTRRNGKFIEFEFITEIEEKANTWQFNPTPDMLLIQRFLLEKDKLLSFLKTKREELE